MAIDHAIKNSTIGTLTGLICNRIGPPPDSLCSQAVLGCLSRCRGGSPLEKALSAV